MSEASIKARLGLDASDFKVSAKGAQAEVTALSAKVRDGNAAIAEYQRQMKAAAGGTVEQKKALKEAKAAIADYRSELKQAERDLKSFNATRPAPVAINTNPLSVPFGRGGKASSGGEHGGGGGNAQELGHSIRSFTDMIMSGQSPVQALEVEVGRLSQAFGGGTGALILTAGITAAVVKMHELVVESQNLHKELIGATQPLGGGGAAFTSLDLLESKVKSMRSVLTTSLAGEGTYGRAFGDFGEDLMTVFQKGKTMKPGDESATRRAGETSALENAISSEVGAIANKYKGRNDLAREALDKGPDSVADRKAEQEMNERIGDIRRDPDLQTHGTELSKAAREAAQIQKDANAAERADTAAVIALENRILEIKRAGLNVDLESAKATRDAAEEYLKRHPKLEGNALAEAQARIDAANQKLTEANLSAGNDRIDHEESQDRAQMGRGWMERVRLIDRELDRNAERASNNARYNPGDTKTADQLAENSAALVRTKEDIFYAQEREYAAAQATTKEMQLQLQGNSRKAAELREIVGYDEKIAAAERDKNFELAEQLKNQKALSAMVRQMAEQNMTPDERAARDRQDWQSREAYRRAQNINARGTQNAANNSADSAFDNPDNAFSTDAQTDSVFDNPDDAFSSFPQSSPAPSPSMPMAMPAPDVGGYTGPDFDSGGIIKALTVHGTMLAKAFESATSCPG